MNNGIIKIKLVEYYDGGKYYICQFKRAYVYVPERESLRCTSPVLRIEADATGKICEFETQNTIYKLIKE